MLGATPSRRGGPSKLAAALAAISISLVGGVVHAEDEGTTRLVTRLREILRSPELDGAIVGVHVRDVKTDQTLFSRNGTKLFNPASNVKLVTTGAALWYLGSSYRFRTYVYRDPLLDGTTLRGNLYVRGGGDPTLTNERLFALANDIAMHGISRVEGNLVIDDTFFDDVHEGPGWEQERSDKSYAPPVGAFSANFGTFMLKVLPGPRVGAPAVVTVFPPVPSIALAHTVTTRSPGSRSRVFVGTTRSPENTIEVTARGGVALRSSYGETFYRRVGHPTMYAGEALRAILEMRGVKITGKVRMGTVPRRKVAIAMAASPQLSTVVSTLNKYSNNFIAEQMLKTLGAEIRGAPGTWQKGSEVIGDFLAEVGVPRGSFVLGNGSGLNDINRLTPEQITTILRAMYRRFEVRSEYVASLAVAGVSGTITRRFSDEPAQSRLRAKTGSLRGVSALSGYVVTRDERMLAFSVMMNDYVGRAGRMWDVQDEIGNALADFRTADVVAQP